MNTEQENKYTAQLAKSHYGTWSASELLHIMRPEVEEILKENEITQPPSQSVRAQDLLSRLNMRINMEWPMEAKLEIIKRRNLLNDFLAVHRTVWILEGKPV